MSSTQEVGEIFGEGQGPAQSILRSPIVLIFSLGLWGMNVYFFKLTKIDYVRVLKYDLLVLEGGSPKRRVSEGSITEANSRDEDDEEDGVVEVVSRVVDSGSEITDRKLVWLSICLLILLYSTYYIWIDVLGRGSVGAIFAFYAATMVVIVTPCPSTRWVRRSAVIVLQRSFELINPRCSCINNDPAGPRPIPFVDVFFADAMCSLSKVFFDWGLLFHMACHYPAPVPPAMHNILIPSACAAVPFVIRARQCLIMHTVGRIKNDPKRYQHLLNALKYSTSIFPLCLSAYQKTVTDERAQELETYLILLLTINALYALYWDVVMDWGMMQNPYMLIEHHAPCVGNNPYQVAAEPSAAMPVCGHALLRSRLRFGVCVSALIMMIDAVLRFSWTLRFTSYLFPSSDHFVLATQFLEVFRRAIWNLLRVEWENIKQQAGDHHKMDETEPRHEEDGVGFLAQSVISIGPMGPPKVAED